MSVILGIGLTMAAWAAPPPYYEDRSLKLTLTLPSRDEATLRMAMGQVMVGKVKRVYRTLEDGTRQRVGIGRLDDAELLASMVAITANVRGAEADMVVKDLAGDLIPVTVWWDDRKNFALQRGEPLEMAFDGSLTPASIRQKHEIAEIVDADRTWDHRALQIVDEALSSLSAAELERVRDVPFHRVSAPSEAVLSGLIQGPDQELAAVYTVDDAGARIEVYDAAIAPPGRFVGSPSDPRPAAFMVILHEIGHALAMADHRKQAAGVRDLLARQRALAAELESETAEINRRVAAYNRRPTRAERTALESEQARLEERIAENNAMVQEIEAQRGLLQQRQLTRAAKRVKGLLDGGDAPTHYGRTHPEEAFAECFALYHADPDALLRAAPDIHAWLSKNAHVNPGS